MPFAFVVLAAVALGQVPAYRMTRDNNNSSIISSYNKIGQFYVVVDLSGKKFQVFEKSVVEIEPLSAEALEAEKASLAAERAKLDHEAWERKEAEAEATAKKWWSLPSGEVRTSARTAPRTEARVTPPGVHSPEYLVKKARARVHARSQSAMLDSYAGSMGGSSGGGASSSSLCGRRD